MTTFTASSAGKALNDLALGLSDRRVPNKQLSVQLEGFVLNNFDQEGALRGGWEPLKPSTILARLRKSPAGKRAKGLAGALAKAGRKSADIAATTGAGLVKILQDTGAMRQSFAAFSDNDVAGVGARSGAQHAELTAIHEYGDPSRNIPARPMLPTPDQALQMAYDVYEAYVEKARKDAGL